MLLSLQALLLAAACMVLCAPFLRWPPDNHFGTHGLWALFRKPGERLPAEYVQITNLGVSRIFLHYLVLGARLAFGRRNLHVRVRQAQYATVLLGAILLLPVLRDLAVGPWSAWLAALLLLFAATRPQLGLAAFNAEPYYAVATMLAMWPLLDAAGQGAVPGSPALMGFAALYCFAALNLKPHYLVEPFLVGLACWAQQGLALIPAAALAGGAFAGCAAFALLFRRDITAESLTTLRNYARNSGMVAPSLADMWGIIRMRYATSLRQSPLVALAALAALGLVLGPWTPAKGLLCVWLVGSLLAVVVQTRFELAHFYPPMLPAALLAGLGLSALLEQGPATLLAGLALCSWLARHSLLELPRIFRPAPLEEQLRRVYGELAPHYWETRLDVAVEHHLRHGGDFLAWGPAPQVHALAEHAPFTRVVLFHHAIWPIYPRAREILLADLLRVRPAWVYDFNCWHGAYGGFNPVSVMLATGLVYVPAGRVRNVALYRLDGQGTALGPAGLGLLVRATALADVLEDEWTSAGRTAEELPPEWRLGLGSLAAAVALGARPALSAAAMRAIANLPRLGPEGTGRVTLLALAATLSLAGQTGSAREVMAAWGAELRALERVSPLLGVVRALLERSLLGLPAGLRLDGIALEDMALSEAQELLASLFAASLAPVITPEERARIWSLPGIFHDQERMYVDERQERAGDVLRRLVECPDTGAMLRGMADIEAPLRDPMLLSLPFLTLAGLFLMAREDLPVLAGKVERVMGPDRRSGKPRVVLFGLNAFGLGLLAAAGIAPVLEVLAVVDSYKHGLVPEVLGVPLVHVNAVAGLAPDAVVVCALTPGAVGQIVSGLRGEGLPCPVLWRTGEGRAAAWEMAGPPPGGAVSGKTLG